MMTEKNHFQRQYDFLQRAQTLDQEIKELEERANKLNHENNEMWAELDALQQILPDDQVSKVKFNLIDRTKYEKKSREQESQPKSLIHVRKYKGPVIVPQLPKSVKAQIPFQSFVDEENQGYLDLLRYQKKILKERSQSVHRAGFAQDRIKSKLTPNEKNLLLQPEYKYLLENAKHPWSTKNKPHSVDLGASPMKKLKDSYIMDYDDQN